MPAQPRPLLLISGSPRKLISTAIGCAIATFACAAVAAADQVASEPKNASIRASKPGVGTSDFFMVPVWGLRIGGTAEIRPPANDSWKYFTAGKGILKVTPSYLEYGERVIGAYVQPDVVYLQNIGAEPLSIGTISAPHQYVASQECSGALLPPMGTCIFTIQMTPVDTRTANGYVSVPFSAVDGSGSKVTAFVTVLGTVVRPPTGSPEHELGGGLEKLPPEEPSPDAPASRPTYLLRFPPPIYLGDSPKQRKFLLQATGTADLPIKSIGVTEGSMFYAPSHNCPPVLAKGTACEITVQLNPLQEGALTGELRIESASHEDTDVRVGLIAEVDKWVRKLTYDEKLDWGLVDRGLLATRTVTVANTGNLAAENVSSKSVAPFTLVSSNCPTVLQPNSACQFTFSLNSSVDGPVARDIPISAKDLSIEGAPLTMTANVQLRQGTFSPTSMAFGLRDMAKLSSPQPLVFTNTGTTTVTPYLGALNAPDSSKAAYGTSFLQSSTTPWLFIDPGTCGQPVKVGATCNALVATQPTATTYQSATLQLFPAQGMTARGTTLSVSVSGTKQSFVFSPTVLDFGVVNGLEVVEREITVTNTSLDGTTLTGLESFIKDPSNGVGGLTATGGTCLSSLPAATKSCTIKVQLHGASLIRAETQESKTGEFRFRYNGADTNLTTVPVHFLLRGNSVEVSASELDFGDIPTGGTFGTYARRSFKITNPGPSTVAVPSFYLLGPVPRDYGLQANLDTAPAGSCSPDKALAAGASCQMNIYAWVPSNGAWGATSNAIQLRARNNLVYENLGAPISVKANVLEPRVSVPEEVTVLTGEATAATQTVPFQLISGGTVEVDTRALSPNPGVTANVSGCYGQVDKSYRCTMNLQFTAKKGDGTREFDVPVSVYSSGEYREIARFRVKEVGEKASYTLTNPTWHLGDTPSLASYLDDPQLKQTSVLKNTSARATIRFERLDEYTNILTRNTASMVIDGVSVPPCSAANSLPPQAQCHWSHSVTPVEGLNWQGAYTTTPTMTATAFNEFGVISKPFSANFLPGELSIVEAPTDFESVPASTWSPAKSLRLKNTGKGYLRWSNAPTIGSGHHMVLSSPFLLLYKGSYFSQASRTGGGHKSANSSPDLACFDYMGLAPGAECKHDIAMAPQGSSASYTGNLKFGVHQPTKTEFSVDLAGRSVAPIVFYSAPAVNFPKNMLVGTTYTQELVIGNGGNYPLQLYKLSLAAVYGGVIPPELVLEHNCPTALPSGEECVARISFTPDTNYIWDGYYRLDVLSGSLNVGTPATFPISGTSTGAFLTLTPEKLDTLQWENVNQPSAYITTITARASGAAPFRVTAGPALTFPFVLKSTTCVTGKTYLPGESCDIEVWTDEKLGTISNFGATTFSYAPVVLKTNGEQRSSTGSTLSTGQHSVPFRGELMKPLAGLHFYPSVVPARRSVPLTFSSHDLKKGTKLFVNGAEREQDGESFMSVGIAPLSETYPFAAHQYVATGATADVPLAWRLPGTATRHQSQLKVLDYTLALPGEGQSVYTASLGAPRPAYYSIASRLPLAGGGELILVYYQRYGAVLRTDIAGRITSSTSVFQLQDTNLSHVNGSITPVDSDRFKVRLAALSWYDDGCGWNCSNKITQLFEYSGTISLSSQGELASAFQPKVERLAQDSIRNGDYRPPLKAHGSALFDADDGNYLSAYSLQDQNGYRVTLQGKYKNVAFQGSLSGVPQGVAPSGLAMVGNYAYLWMQDSIFVFDLTRSLSTPPMRFQFADVLAATSNPGMAYNADAGALVVTCYSGTAICSIPVKDGALGAASVEVGRPGVAGINDGSAQNATISATRLQKVNASGSVVGFESSQFTNSTRVAQLSTTPTFGGIGAQNSEFTISLDESGAAVPHVVALKNQGASPFSVLALSDASITYETTCTAVPSLGECQVTVSIPHTAWQAASEGSFQIETTGGISVPVHWKAPGP